MKKFVRRFAGERWISDEASMDREETRVAVEGHQGLLEGDCSKERNDEGGSGLLCLDDGLIQFFKDPDNVQPNAKELRQQLGSLKKGSSSIDEYVLRANNIDNSLKLDEDQILDRDLLLSVLNGVGHKVDIVVVMLTSQQNTISPYDAQYMLMIHEQQIEHLNSIAQNDVSPSTNFVTSNNNGGRGKRNK
ncbi:hypothetical protein Ddye_013364 [Dipteronia dyeriana]|uniref:Uncharacterized protein n=1 Tax=Dipteronia dyeriana TaxID=168575 RepID=A0AAD9X641_9ROSI|nr:hypothetical protein Ddye_013364 [Dipteronia dyeriana]